MDGLDHLGSQKRFQQAWQCFESEILGVKISAPDDEVSLKSKAKPGPELYVAVKFYAQSQNSWRRSSSINWR